MPMVRPDSLSGRYDLIVAGTGFGSLFFLHGFLKKYPNARVLLLEWGKYRDQAWQIKNQLNADPEFHPSKTMIVPQGNKLWNYTIGYGGGTNCWVGQTPRLLPSDFKLKTLYGVGEDWPLTYDELEPYYLEAEQTMHVSGPDAIAVHYPRSAPYPHPPHNMSDADKIMQAAMPEFHFAAPCARLRTPLGNRGACCGSMNCSLCPTEAKFTALNSMGGLIEHPTVSLCVESRVVAVETSGGMATGLRFVSDGREHVANSDLIALGCNAIHTPFILLRSGFQHPALGKYIHEKICLNFDVLLDGVDNFGGTPPLSSCSLALAGGDDRRTHGAGFVYFLNFWRFGLRTEWGRWRQTLPIEVFVEDLPQETNYVEAKGDLPVVHHTGNSDYAWRGVDRAIAKLPDLLKPLPVEKIVRYPDTPTNSHIQGTCRMGNDPAKSIVDRDLVHHTVRNLLVLGTAVWPTCGTGNPSLTAAALSLRAAERIGA